MTHQSSGGGKPVVTQPPYSPPQGPKGINDPKEPGLHGANHGTCGTQSKG